MASQYVAKLHLQSMRSKREMTTLAEILDEIVQGNPEAAADILCQRMKAIITAGETGTWEKAEQMELIPPEGMSLATNQDRAGAARGVHLQRRYEAPTQSQGTSRGRGIGRGGKGRGGGEAPSAAVKREE